MNNFCQITTQELEICDRINLTATGLKLFIKLKIFNPFGDAFKRCPSLRKLAEQMGCSVATIRREIAKMIQGGLLIFDMGFGLVKSGFHKGKKVAQYLADKFFLSKKECKEKIKIVPIQIEMKLEDQTCNFETSDAPPVGKSESLQTDQTSSHHPDGEGDRSFSNLELTKSEGVDEKVNKQEKTVLTEVETKEATPTHVTQNNSQRVTNEDIPSELLEKMRSLSINLTGQVKARIKEHHISQAYGAAAHVDNTWETINDPTKVFLYQLSKQPIEKLGARHDEKLIEDIKRRNSQIDKEIEANPNMMQRARAMLEQRLGKKIRQKNSP